MKNGWDGYCSSVVEGKYEIESLLSIAQEAVESKTAGSKLLRKTTPKGCVPKFFHHEIGVGSFLGRGGFCSVHEVNSIALAVPDDENEEQFEGVSHIPNSDVIQDRFFMASNYRRSAKGKSFRYAIKRVHKSSIRNAQMFVNGVVDLALEARFLTALRHPNIIKMRATAATDPFDPDRTFYIVIDKLNEILPSRIRSWKAKDKSFANTFDCKGKIRTILWFERINVAFGIAKALQYIHSQSVIYRDIKPENIGFDIRGDVKIFDFGLAREIMPHSAESDLFHLTGDTGSPRYMAPEVASGKPYNKLVDVYSFSVLLWELLSLQVPFKNYVTLASFRENVVEKSARPKCDASWPMTITHTIENGWSTDITRRPNMACIIEIIARELNSDNSTAIESQDSYHAGISSDCVSMKSAISYRRMTKKMKKSPTKVSRL